MHAEAKLMLPKSASRCTIRGTGILGAPDIQVWRDNGDWHYDGIVSGAPPHIRKQPRGPYWRGPVTRRFVGTLLRAAEKRGFKVECA
jgi:hypothetical protein